MHEDLPEPEGPTSATVSPGSTVKDRSCMDCLLTVEIVAHAQNRLVRPGRVGEVHIPELDASSDFLLHSALVRDCRLAIDVFEHLTGVR